MSPTAKCHQDDGKGKWIRDSDSIQSIWILVCRLCIASSQQSENKYSVALTKCQCKAVVLGIQLFQAEQQKLQKYHDVDFAVRPIRLHMPVCCLQWGKIGHFTSIFDFEYKNYQT